MSAAAGTRKRYTPKKTAIRPRRYTVVANIEEEEGAAAAAAEYKIVMKETEIQARAQGDFYLRKDFEVKQIGSRAKVTSGAIVQLVEKSVIVDAFDETGHLIRMTTEEEISDYTSGQVEHMTLTYIELFKYEPETVERGKRYAAAWQGDQFQNGAIARYEKSPRARKYHAVIVDNPTPQEQKYLSSGSVFIRGTLLYIPNYEDAKAAGGFELSTDDHPANKLEVATLPVEATWGRLLALNRAEIRTHEVRVTWELAGAEESKTTIQSRFDGAAFRTRRPTA